jgi:3-methyladenine DNA glycosylase AlkC
MPSRRAPTRPAPRARRAAGPAGAPAVLGAPAAPPAARRRGATRVADVPPDVLAALERGELETATLAEGLAVDFARLLRATFPELDPAAHAEAEAAAALGVSRRMAALGGLLLDRLGQAGLARAGAHRSDTVRGWACFMVGARPRLDLAARLAAIRPLADDPHFGVREWAWMAVRPHLAAAPAEAIALLARWTAEPSERLRRFASEATRPRGVWCAHLSALRTDPALGLPVLEPLRADPSRYVQDSVGNWLNDAAKDHPAWVRALCRTWLRGDPAPATGRICDRALRSLR